tara:strand:- start:1061412 stop:1062251 length:840 start_codon:yes stop_codon:yes gene_type:complete
VNSDVCTVAADVGNSALKLCVRRHESFVDKDDSNRLDEHSIYLDAPDWHTAAIDWVREHAGCNRTCWWIASVHREAADQLGRAIERGDGSASIKQVHSVDVPIQADVDDPGRVGVDRLLGAFAAWNRFKSAVVVVDAGSAITVDWVCDQGHFHGGAIMPGLRLQTRVLATGTDALPKIEWQQASTASECKPGTQACQRLRPAKNTVDAIRLGVLTGAAAGIDRLAEQYASNQECANGDDPAAARLVVTGGDAAIISKYLRQQHQQVSNLACRGLLQMAE